MESPRLWPLTVLGAALLFLLPLLGARAQEDAELQPRALDIYSAVEDTSHEKELVGISRISLGCPPSPSVHASVLPPSLPPLLPRVRVLGDERGDERKGSAPAAAI